MTNPSAIMLAKGALEESFTAMNDYLNGVHKGATYFSNPIDLCEKALAALSAGAGEAQANDGATLEGILLLDGLYGRRELNKQEQEIFCKLSLQALEKSKQMSAPPREDLKGAEEWENEIVSQAMSKMAGSCDLDLLKSIIERIQRNAIAFVSGEKIGGGNG